MTEADQKKDGYLIVGESVWNPETDLQDLPEAWLRRARERPDCARFKESRAFPPEALV